MNELVTNRYIMETQDRIFRSEEGVAYTTSCMISQILNLDHKKLIGLIKSADCSPVFWENNFRKRAHHDGKKSFQECFEITKGGFQLIIPDLRSDHNDGILSEFLKAF